MREAKPVSCRKLGVGDVELLLDRRDHAVVPHVADDSDDGHPGAVLPVRAHPYALSDRVLSRPVDPREGLVDERDRKRAGDVGALECASRAHPLSERFERAVGEDLPVSLGAAPGRLDVALDVQAPVADLGAERKGAHDAGLADSGKAAHAFEQRAVERDDLLRLLVARLGRPQLQRQDVLRIEAQVHARERGETAEHQAGAEQQDDGERHLRGGERAAEALPAEAGRGSRRAVAQRLGEVEPQHPQGRGESEEERRRDRERGREEQQAGLDPDRRERRKPRRSVRGDPAHAGPGDGEAEQGTRAGQDEALGQELPDEPRLPRADRRAHRDLALAPLGPGEQQVRDVGARHQEQEPDRAEDEGSARRAPPRISSSTGTAKASNRISTG